MKFESKYDLGQPLWHIVRTSKSIREDCPICVDKEFVEVEARGQKFKTACPKRHEWNHRPVTSYVYDWYVEEYGWPGRVGNIKISVYIGGKQPGHDEGIKYMLTNRGVGSGTVFDESELFPSKEEAQLECDRRNEQKETYTACPNCYRELLEPNGTCFCHAKRKRVRAIK